MAGAIIVNRSVQLKNVVNRKQKLKNVLWSWKKTHPTLVRPRL